MEERDTSTTMAGADLKVEAKNLTCVPKDAFHLVEPYARIIVNLCQAREILLRAAGQRSEEMSILALRRELEARFGTLA